MYVKEMAVIAILSFLLQGRNKDYLLLKIFLEIYLELHFPICLFGLDCHNNMPYAGYLTH